MPIRSGKMTSGFSSQCNLPLSPMCLSQRILTGSMETGVFAAEAPGRRSPLSHEYLAASCLGTSAHLQQVLTAQDDTMVTTLKRGTAFTTADTLESLPA